MDLNTTVNPVLFIPAVQVEVDLTLEKCNNRQDNKVVYCIMRHADFRYSRQYIITYFHNIQVFKSYFKY